MPRGDGTGPAGTGYGRGRGLGAGPGGQRLGRNVGGAFGPGGQCICAKCGTRIPHEQGMSCTQVKCPQCGHTMIREELLNEKRQGRS
ncbi:hypothetical protein [Ectothiorhodospira mobilis]|uniref:hypothetical protein n=1 Tax=Ectothiorhodospira mobilis TaxID=195064 RepID=UPI001903E3CA|nr:hypothetical protein [Ectothiorhodospira mobilis]MBK1691022.1 hypothetical protein [Ectothiorhodospira mobilis]